MLSLWIRLSTLIITATMVVVIGFLAVGSGPFWAETGLQALMGAQWHPYEETFGLLAAVVGSLWTLVLAAALAVPTGVAAALTAAELLPPRARHATRMTMELLAGIPSIVYGLLGLWVLLPWLQSTLGLLTGHSLLAAGLLLATMALPTIMLLSLEALQGVPAEQRETARSLGLSWTQQVARVLLPQSWPGIRSAVLLAMGRALGETMAVMLVVGSLDRLPNPWYNLLTPAQTLTSRLGREIGEATYGSLHWSALMACGLILALAAMGLTLLAHLPGRRP